MNYGKILKIGFKVLIAAVAGAAVFIGVDKASNGNNQRKPNNSFQDDPCFSTGNGNRFNNGSPTTQVRRNEDDSNFVSKMKNVQDSCGKLFAFVQSLTVVADNFSRIFQNNGNSCIGQPYYGNNRWGYQPVNLGNGVIWNRISPYIVEVGTESGYNGC